jgi:heterodisulfide reductase subunit A-like polyferredoxin
MSELGIANVVARSPFVNQVDEELCYGCELCLDACQFEALALEDGKMSVSQLRCVGCGVCVPACPDGALSLVRRPAAEIAAIPADELAWLQERAQGRGLDLSAVM